MSDERRIDSDPVRGVDGLLRGLESVLNAAAELADKTQSVVECTRTGSIGPPGGLRAAYGVSLRVGPGKTPRGRFPNLASRFRKATGAEDIREPAGDIFDEGDHYLLVTELPGVEPSKVAWCTSANQVTVSGSCSHVKYHKQFDLPSPIDERRNTSSYKNGILELRLWKLAAE